MPLQNRVTPFADLVATTVRGRMMGNRGGRIHDASRQLGARRWASKQWICCVLAFKGRQRKVWGDSYTELFFLDEVTALAAGHRPCFECRRKDARAFASLFPRAHTAPEMDAVLHSERLDGRAKRTHRAAIDALPDGAMIAGDGEAFAMRGKHLLRWTPAGYGKTVPRPLGGDVDVLTPPSIIEVLKRGYAPLWHPSAAP
ncbi:MAG TPA: hypothetical protein VNR39_00985 [Pseudolabrys sp.]|nr:hypothetical protein [Pseudolabrys sp.]